MKESFSTTTPLPPVQMSVIFLVQICEAMNINVLFPFLAFLVEDLGYTGSRLGTRSFPPHNLLHVLSHYIFIAVTVYFISWFILINLEIAFFDNFIDNISTKHFSTCVLFLFLPLSFHIKTLKLNSKYSLCTSPSISHKVSMRVV